MRRDTILDYLEHFYNHKTGVSLWRHSLSQHSEELLVKWTNCVLLIWNSAAIANKTIKVSWNNSYYNNELALQSIENQGLPVDY